MANSDKEGINLQTVASNGNVELPVTLRGQCGNPFFLKKINKIFKPIIIIFCARIKKFKHLSIFNFIDFKLS
jgi:hypothetical protein